jgi:hypothetical protein
MKKSAKFGYGVVSTLYFEYLGTNITIFNQKIDQK